MSVYIDQLNRRLHIDRTPLRIISIVPSITELLADLGLEDRVIAVTKFCEFPPTWRKSKEIIGGTKNLRLAKIEELQPDLIIANKEENTQEEVETLMTNFPVWMTDVKNFEDALDMIRSLGILLQVQKRAEALIININQAATKLHQLLKGLPKIKVAYMIWQRPIMVAGGDTFIHDMLARSGCENVFVNSNRYPTISEKELKEAAPDFILLSSEPYPFKEKDIDFFKNICPTAVVQLIDGTFYSWYGSRLLPAMEYFYNFRLTTALDD